MEVQLQRISDTKGVSAEVMDKVKSTLDLLEEKRAEREAEDKSWASRAKSGGQEPTAGLGFPPS